MTKRKFYKKTYTITVLAEDLEDLPEACAADIHEATFGGPCSGAVEEGAPEEVDGPTMANLLLVQGSDPEFFGLTELGEDVDEPEGA